jgi:hypothetical protein
MFCRSGLNLKSVHLVLIYAEHIRFEYQATRIVSWSLFHEDIPHIGAKNLRCDEAAYWCYH